MTQVIWKGYEEMASTLELLTTQTSQLSSADSQEQVHLAMACNIPSGSEAYGKLYPEKSSDGAHPLQAPAPDPGVWLEDVMRD